jgi:DNA-binding transcriptional regulator YdaS (Cro superfamily)
MSEALLRARKILGSGVKLAKAIGTSASAVNAWMTKAVNVPLECAFEIERVTGGVVQWTEVAPHLAHYKKRWEECAIMHHSFCLESLHISIDRIKHSEKKPLDLQAIKMIAENIVQFGLERPICVNHDNHLIFGIKRLEASKYLAKTTIPSWRLSLSDLLNGKYPQAIIKNTFQMSERVAIGIALEKHIGERRGKRKEAAIFSVKKRTNEVIAKLLTFGSRESYMQARKVYLHGVPVLIANMDAQHLSISTAAGLSTLSAEDQNHILDLPKHSIMKLVRQKSFCSLPQVNGHLETEAVT